MDPDGVAPVLWQGSPERVESLAKSETDSAEANQSQESDIEEHDECTSPETVRSVVDASPVPQELSEEDGSSDDPQQTATSESSDPETETDPETDPESDPDDTAMNDVTCHLFDQYDSSRMQLTPEEHKWALDVKHAIEKIPDLDKLSDFTYAQIAIISGGNIDDAINRAYRLQDQKVSNGIMDTLDDALRNLPKEAIWLSIDYNLQTGGYICAADITKTNAQIWKNRKELQYYHRRSFYAAHMASCDLAAVRAGLTLLIECEGYRVQKGKALDLTIFRSMLKGLHAYPRRVTQIKFFNSPLLFNAMAALAKSSLPREMTSKFEVSAKFPAGRLDKFYHLPTPEIAKARLQERMKDLLIRRYANEKYFRLHPEAPVSASINESAAA